MSTSRYQSSPILNYISPNGKPVRYRAPRTLPPIPDGAPTTTVRDDEVNRLDLIAARTVGNPLLAWRIADVNLALDQFELCAAPGRALAIPPAVI